MKKKTYVIKDELTDDFGTTVKSDKIKPLPEDYEYMTTSAVGRALDWFAYRCIAKPLAFLYVKIVLRQKFVNAKSLRDHEGGLFIYANHTLSVGDTFIPNIVDFSRNNYILAGEQANSLTAILPILRAVGSVPLTSNMRQNIKMGKCLKTRIGQGASVTVYPEAHVWPYYTGVRRFTSISFKYAVTNKAPIFCMTNCFVRRKVGKKPKVLTFIDGPFFPRDDLSVSDNAEYLRDVVYRCMVDRTSKYSTYEFNTYVRAEDSQDV